jgi:hypothetical protein
MSCFAFLNSFGKEKKKRAMGVCRNEEQTKMKNGSKIRIQVEKKTFFEAITPQASNITEPTNSNNLLIKMLLIKAGHLRQIVLLCLKLAQ